MVGRLGGTREQVLSVRVELRYDQGRRRGQTHPDRPRMPESSCQALVTSHWLFQGEAISQSPVFLVRWAVCKPLLLEVPKKIELVPDEHLGRNKAVREDHEVVARRCQ